MRKPKVTHLPGTALQTLKAATARKPRAVVIIELSQDGEGIVSWSRQPAVELMLAERRFRLTIDQVICEAEEMG